MPQPTQVTAVAEQAADRIDRTWRTVAAAQQALLGALAAGRTAGLARLLRRLQAASTATQRELAAVAEDLARRGVPVAYGYGVLSTADGIAWDDDRVAAVTRLAQDTYDDLLAASRQVGQSSARLVRQVRATAAARIPAGTRAGLTAAEIGRLMARDLHGAGVNAVIYSDGSRHGAAEYADVVARAKVATAYNAGTVSQLRRDRVELVEVFDGVGCGVRTHTDPEKAAGQLWTLARADAYPISHPRCQRSFGKAAA
jgi:hypothetical protein